MFEFPAVYGVCSEVHLTDNEEKYSCFKMKVSKSKWLCYQLYVHTCMKIGGGGGIVLFATAKSYFHAKENTKNYEQSKQICPDSKTSF